MFDTDGVRFDLLQIFSLSNKLATIVVKVPVV